MGEFNPYRLSDFEWDMLQVYLKYGYGDRKLYDTTMFQCSLTDETVLLTLAEFAERAVDYDDVLWANKVKGNI